jgi:hypothetical protein
LGLQALQLKFAFARYLARFNPVQLECSAVANAHDMGITSTMQKRIAR